MRKNKDITFLPPCQKHVYLFYDARARVYPVRIHESYLVTLSSFILVIGLIPFEYLGSVSVRRLGLEVICMLL